MQWTVKQASASMPVLIELLRGQPLSVSDNLRNWEDRRSLFGEKRADYVSPMIALELKLHANLQTEVTSEDLLTLSVESPSGETLTLSLLRPRTIDQTST